MNTEDFNKVVDFRINEIKSVLQKKAVEYSSAADRLHNFKKAAAFTNITPQKALFGMMMKHWTSVSDIVDTYQPGEQVNIDMINEKIGDSINYLILLEALFKE